MFAVRDDHDRRILKDALESRRIVNQHVAGRRTHEDLYAAGLPDFQGLDLLDVAVGRAEIETIVGRATMLGQRILVGQGLSRRGLGVHVRHVHEAGDPTSDGCRGLGRQVPLVGKPRFTEVYLVVDHAGHEQPPGGVDHVDAVARGDRRPDPADSLALDEDVRVTGFTLVNEARIGDEQFVQSTDSACMSS